MGARDTQRGVEEVGKGSTLFFLKKKTKTKQSKPTKCHWYWNPGSLIWKCAATPSAGCCSPGTFSCRFSSGIMARFSRRRRTCLLMSPKGCKSLAVVAVVDDASSDSKRFLKWREKSEEALNCSYRLRTTSCCCSSCPEVSCSFSASRGDDQGKDLFSKSAFGKLKRW